MSDLILPMPGNLSVFFNQPRTDNSRPNNRISSVRMHRALYNAYLELCIAAWIAVHTTNDVLVSPEHQEVMQEAAESGLYMPDIDPVSESIERLRESLAKFNPYTIHSRHEDIVRLPGHVARGFYAVAMSVDEMLVSVSSTIGASEYMRGFRQMKAAGKTYTGPVSLQEIFNTWHSLWAIEVLQQHFKISRQEKLQGNWVACLV